jgi:GTPase SAR1 family protein
LFVFPNITKCPDLAEKEITLNSFSDILNDKKVIIRGDGQSGKTTLCNHIFLNLVENKQPVLLIDLNDIENKKPSVDVFQKNYTEQYTGDFKIWNDKKDKIIIFDNLSHVGKSIEHIVFAQSYFSMVIITTSFEEYGSYFKDDDRLADFSLLTIRPFSHVKQEKLIKKWLDLKHENFEHGKIDQVENNINSIIINNNILPRYPFFILSILQTYEVFMPQDLKITAYGHCYHALIVAHLIKSGIAKEDNSITTCFNYASHLAFEIYNKNPTSLFITINDYEDFKEKYKKRFIIADSLINRLHGKYGIVKEFNGKGYRFSLAYSYYYFLGQYLAKNYKDNVNLLDDMVKYSYRKNNSLTLIFTIHHAQDEEIIDNILTYTICAIDGINPAKLDKEETAIFKDIISIIPERVISNKDVEQERNNERELRDKVETEPKNVSETEFENDNNGLNQIYQCHKNMEILSQILKNKYGSLERTKVTEIVETICDAGLRLANIFLSDSDQLEEFIIYIQRRYENSRKLEGKPFSQEQIDKIKKIVIFRIFMWVVHHLERAVSSINKPEIAEIIKDLTIKKNTPAYQLICYFYSLDTTQFFGESQKENLKSIIQKYDKKDMFFLHRILSIRTQHYMNTHEIKMPVKQAVSSLLEIK